MNEAYRIACLGGIYSNYLALDQAVVQIRAQGADEIYCLGDLGAFGPYPDRVFPLLVANEIRVVQGNYDDSVGNQLDDCQCGYTDPRDNYFAQLSYNYTLDNTSAANQQWLASLPKSICLNVQGSRVLFVHGSPRKANEFLWQSTTSNSFLNYLFDTYAADVIVATHTGIKWSRHLDEPQTGKHRLLVNCGAIGRPENDGKTCVWYAMLHFQQGKPPRVEFHPVAYDHRRLAAEMQSEKLPDEFAQTILTGWWTTCLEILPAKERRRGKF